MKNPFRANPIFLPATLVTIISGMLSSAMAVQSLLGSAGGWASLVVPSIALTAASIFKDRFISRLLDIMHPVKVVASIIGTIAIPVLWSTAWIVRRLARPFGLRFFSISVLTAAAWLPAFLAVKAIVELWSRVPDDGN